MPNTSCSPSTFSNTRILSNTICFNYGENRGFDTRNLQKNFGFNCLCVPSLKSDPRSSNAGLEGLARISVDILQNKANDTLPYIGNLFKNVTDPVMYRFYASCIEDYRASVERQLPEAINALASKDYVESKNDAAAAATNVDAFEQQFADKSPFSDRNKVVHDLSLAASSIISLLG